MRRSHEVKSWPANFVDALTGRKRFEVRKDDRLYETGDTIILCEWDPIAGPEDEPGTPPGPGRAMRFKPRGYTGRRAFFVIGYVERSACIPSGWCAFELLSPEELQRTAAAVLRSKA